MHYALYPNNLIMQVARDRKQFPKSVMPFVVSEEELLAMNPDRLLSIYNKNCEIQIKGFSSSQEARERTLQFVTDYYHLQEIPMAKRQQNADTNAETATENTETAAKERASRIPKDSTIKLISTSNPKRSGSAAHTRFALYTDGMTVGQFLEAGGTMADINFDVAKKFIELSSVEASVAEAVAG